MKSLIAQHSTLQTKWSSRRFFALLEWLMTWYSCLKILYVTQVDASVMRNYDLKITTRISTMDAMILLLRIYYSIFWIRFSLIFPRFQLINYQIQSIVSLITNKGIFPFRNDFLQRWRKMLFIDFIRCTSVHHTYFCLCLPWLVCCLSYLERRKLHEVFLIA